jgi:hypothetical protein
LHLLKKHNMGLKIPQAFTRTHKMLLAKKTWKR